MQWFEPDYSHSLDRLEKAAVTLMAALVVLTFVGTNIQALLWQSSDWLVGTVLPAVVVDLTNSERGGYAAAPLRRNSSLDAAAQAKAEHMVKQGYFAHFAPDGTSPWYFFEGVGYQYAHAGENLAIHFTDSAELVGAWMDSPAHKENIVNANYTEIGVGTAKGKFDGYDTVFVVQLFGTPAVGALADNVQEPQPTILPTAIDAPQQQGQSPASPDELALLRTQLEGLQQAVVQLEQSTPTLPANEPAPETVVLSAEDTIKPELPVVEPAPPATEPARPKPANDVLVIQSQLATSSGLAVAMFTEEIKIEERYPGATIASVATRPNLVLDVVYSGLIGVILLLLCAALVGEVRRLHYVQAAYSLALLAGVGGLWFVHTTLTSGAIVI